MGEKILIPLDGSVVGEAALPHVMDLFSKLSSEVKMEVTLLQVVPLMMHYIAADEIGAQMAYTEEEMEQAKAKAVAYLNEAGQEFESKGIAVQIRTVVGNAADEILKIADEIDADLVAMSTHGRSGISRWAFGSIADRVLRGGTRPVLVVRATAK